MRLSGLEVTARTACRYIRDVTFCLAYLNSLMNPLLYSFLAYGFRNRFYKALQRVKRFVYNFRRRDARKKPDSGSHGHFRLFELISNLDKAKQTQNTSSINQCCGAICVGVFVMELSPINYLTLFDNSMLLRLSWTQKLYYIFCRLVQSNNSLYC